MTSRTPRVAWTAAIIATLAAASAQKQVPAASAGNNFYRMKAVRIMDDQGFGQPVEVARLLVPADWRTEGGVQWDGQELRCPANIIKIRFRAVSADGYRESRSCPDRCGNRRATR